MSNYKMPNEEPSEFGDDLPKQNPWEDDRLGYADTAHYIAKAIINLVAPSGFVIGINGKWGAGKSTLINFVIKHIEKHNSETTDDVTCIEFRPWDISGHQDLIAGFFKILSEKLGPQRGKIARLFAWIFRRVGGTTDSLVDAAASVAIAVDPSGGLASHYTGALAKKSVNDLIAHFLAEPSLQRSYENLRDQLTKSGRRFVVTIDDLDRLEENEVKSIMQMVKTVGRLPNMIYILAYDKNIIGKSLDGVAVSARPSYLEKIVQQEINLPQPARYDLFAILDKKIGFLTGSMTETRRWHYAVNDGINRWIRSPRDIVRFSNALKFSWSALEGELDPLDLIVIEGMRLFDEDAFDWIRSQRNFFFAEGEYAFSPDDRMKAAVKELVDLNIPSQSASIRRLVGMMFPQSYKWLDDRGFIGGEAYVEVVNRRGIGTETGFDTYFGMHPSPDAIPKSIVNKLTSQSISSQEAESLLRSFMEKRDRRKRSMATRLLDELKGQFRIANAARPTEALLHALFRIGEDVFRLEEPEIPFELAAKNQIGFLIGSMLEAWGQETSGKNLIRAFEQESSCAFLADIYVDRGRELAVFEPTSSEPPLVSKSAFDRVGIVLSEKICLAAIAGTLADAPFYFDIVRAWAYLGYTNEAREWISHGVIENPEFLSKSARALISYSVSAEGREYSMKDNPDPSIYDLTVFHRAAKQHIADKNLTSDRRNLFEAVILGCERLLSEK